MTAKSSATAPRPLITTHDRALDALDRLARYAKEHPLDHEVHLFRRFRYEASANLDVVIGLRPIWGLFVQLDSSIYAPIASLASQPVEHTYRRIESCPDASWAMRVFDEWTRPLRQNPEHEYRNGTHVCEMLLSYAQQGPAAFSDAAKPMDPRQKAVMNRLLDDR